MENGTILRTKNFEDKLAKSKGRYCTFVFWAKVIDAELASEWPEDLKDKILGALPDMVKEVGADFNASYEESLKVLQHIAEEKANKQLKKTQEAEGLAAAEEVVKKMGNTIEHRSV